MTINKRVIITPGEPAGIGPDLVIQLAQQNWPVELVVCADPNLLYNRAISLDLPLSLTKYQQYNIPQPQKAGSLTVLPLSVVQLVHPKKLCLKNSAYVLSSLTRACNGCMNGEFAALITGPVHKGVINDAGINFSGHTEFLAKQSKCSRVVMMLTTENLRVALATTHLALKDVSQHITHSNLRQIINILYSELKYKFNIQTPHIFVCGLNPHSGENGYIGREEIDVIIPTLEALRKQGMHLTGPLSADTIFQPKYLQHADVVLAMYHDQGLPVIKYQSFGDAVNITLGLPFIRTSVDHGTALELAGTNLANPSSFKKAINLAITMIKNNNA